MSELIVPVYLNQRLVFDLLAMLQGGISTVTSITKTESDSSTKKREIGAGFGLSEAFSTLLKIDLSGKKTGETNAAQENQTSEERVHTPSSLFFQLRNKLIEQKILKSISSKSVPEAGDIIEFEASLSKNPIVETLDSLKEMMELATLFTRPVIGKKTNEQKMKDQNNARVKAQMEGFSEKLKLGETIDLTASKLSNGYAALITVENQFLNDPMMSDLVDGSFKVLGKVIRSLKTKNDGISLIRNTALSKMPMNILQDAFSNLSSLSETKGFGLPSLVWEVPGPAVQVLPIAIYA